MLAGDVQMMIGNYGVFRGAHEGGRVRVLAISSPERHPSLPDIPSVREAGTDWVLMGFNGMIAPARIPPARRQLLEDAFRAVMEAPDIVQLMLALGSVAAFTPGSALDAHMRDQRAFWTRLVREANIQAE
jgi:tripartite-type tricarboxylate transporter receptor subunit TctC